MCIIDNLSGAMPGDVLRCSNGDFKVVKVITSDAPADMPLVLPGEVAVALPDAARGGCAIVKRIPCEYEVCNCKSHIERGVL